MGVPGIETIQRQIEEVMGGRFKSLGGRGSPRFISDKGIGIFISPEGRSAQRIEIIHFGRKKGDGPPDIELTITEKRQVVTNSDVFKPKNVQIKDQRTGQEVTIYADGQVVHKRIDVRV